MVKYHLTANGPKPCAAHKRVCPIGGAHYGSEEKAQVAYEARLQEEFTILHPVRIIELPGAFGSLRVIDGDLSNHQARFALANGLCGSLALELHELTGATPVFVTYDFDKDASLNALSRDELLAVATHVLIESPSRPGFFIDAYGQKSEEEILEFYGTSSRLTPGSRAALEMYRQPLADGKLSSFAKAALELDSQNRSYSYRE